jgi:serine/threonine-protein kinase
MREMILAGTDAAHDSILHFLAEVEPVAQLRHSHVVPVYSLGDHDGCPYLELEYLGGSLAIK